MAVKQGLKEQLEGLLGPKTSVLDALVFVHYLYPHPNAERKEGTGGRIVAAAGVVVCENLDPHLRTIPWHVYTW